MNLPSHAQNYIGHNHHLERTEILQELDHVTLNLLMASLSCNHRYFGGGQVVLLTMTTHVLVAFAFLSQHNISKKKTSKGSKKGI